LELFTILFTLHWVEGMKIAGAVLTAIGGASVITGAILVCEFKFYEGFGKAL
jgi:hypothetical protein